MLSIDRRLIGLTQFYGNPEVRENRQLRNQRVSRTSTAETHSWRFEVYDDFGRPGYSLTEYGEKWLTTYGLGEMAVDDTRRFDDGRLSLSAVPFRTTSDGGSSKTL